MQAARFRPSKFSLINRCGYRRLYSLPRQILIQSVDHLIDENAECDNLDQVAHSFCKIHSVFWIYMHILWLRHTTTV